MESSIDLFAAIKTGDADRVRSLLTSEPALAAARDEKGVSAVTTAAFHMKKDLVRLLVDAGAPLDVFEASMVGELSRVRALIEKDTSLARARSADGGTALHFASFFGHPAVVEFLLDQGADVRAVAAAFGNVQPLHSAAASQNSRSVELLLQHGADVNAKQQAGWTALHSAAHRGDAATSKLLLQYGADPLTKNDEGVTPIDMARKDGHRELAALLRASAD